MRELLPLTAGQRSVALAAHLYPDSPVNNIGGLVLLEDALDFDLLEKALTLCVARNDALRLRFVRRRKIRSAYAFLYTNAMEQYVDEQPSVSVRFADFSQKSAREMDEEILRWNAKPIDIYNALPFEFTMVKAPDGRQGVFSKIDHMSTDAWSSMALAKEIIELYYALKKGTQLPKEPQSFRSFIESERAYVKSPQFAQDRAYWMARFKKRPHISYIHGGKAYPGGKSGKSRRMEIPLPEELQSALGRFCAEQNVSPPTVFNQAMGVVLSRAADTDDVTFNIPLILRSTLREKTICGPAYNTLANRMEIDGKKSFVGACGELHDDLLGMFRHARYPYANMIAEVLVRHLLKAFFDTYFSFQSTRVHVREPVKFETKWYPNGMFASPFALNVTDINNTGRLTLLYEYQSESFSDERVKEINNSLLAILKNGLSEPLARIDSL